MATVVTLEPDDFVPRGVHEGYRQQLTELFCANSGVTRLEPDKMLRFMNLEVLWLNDNKLTTVPAEIGQLTSLKELHLYDNKLTSAGAAIRELRAVRCDVHLDDGVTVDDL